MKLNLLIEQNFKFKKQDAEHLIYLSTMCFYNNDIQVASQKLGLKKQEFISLANTSNSLSEDNLKKIIQEYFWNVALLDCLTLLLNRHGFLMALRKLILTKNKPGTLIFFDIKNFKKINNNYGHTTGDHVLREVAQRLKKICKGDLLSRFGGDEFIIYLDNISKKSTPIFLEKIRDNLIKPYVYQSQTIEIDGIQLGCSFREINSNRQIDDLIKKADPKCQAAH